MTKLVRKSQHFPTFLRILENFPDFFPQHSILFFERICAILTAKNSTTLRTENPQSFLHKLNKNNLKRTLRKNGPRFFTLKGFRPCIAENRSCCFFFRQPFVPGIYSVKKHPAPLFAVDMVRVARPDSAAVLPPPIPEGVAQRRPPRLPNHFFPFLPRPHKWCDDRRIRWGGLWPPGTRGRHSTSRCWPTCSPSCGSSCARSWRTPRWAGRTLSGGGGQGIGPRRIIQTHQSMFKPV